MPTSKSIRKTWMLIHQFEDIVELRKFLSEEFHQVETLVCDFPKKDFHRCFLKHHHPAGSMTQFSFPMRVVAT